MSKYAEHARGKYCQIRIPGVCTHNPDETVAAHLNGAGMGIKHNDLFIAFACYNCHSAVDGAIKTSYSKKELRLYHYEGVFRTQQILLDDGVLSI